MKKPLKIGILSASAGAGASFLSVVLGKAMLSNGLNPCVLEFENNGLYHALGMDKHFGEGEFFSCQKVLLQGRPVGKLGNHCDGINWCLRSPEDRGLRLDRKGKLRLLHSVKGDPVICDLSGAGVGSGESEDHWKMLWEMDRIVAVLDPLPSRMLTSAEILARLRGSFLPVEYVINRWNRGVDRGAARSFYQLRDPILIPHLDPSDIYSAEYGCRSPWDIPSCRKLLQTPLDELCHRLGLSVA